MAGRPPCDPDEVAAWFAGRLSDDGFDGPISVQVDRDEIIVTGTLPAPTGAPEGDDAAKVAASARISAFREDSRRARMKIAEAAQFQWRRALSLKPEKNQIQLIQTKIEKGLDKRKRPSRGN